MTNERKTPNPNEESLDYRRRPPSGPPNSSSTEFNILCIANETYFIYRITPPSGPPNAPDGEFIIPQ